MERKSSEELQEHMVWTYYGLRVGLSAIGIALPVALVVAGRLLHGISWQDSISAYYHTPYQALSRFGAFATRDIFVGGLLAIGACLYLYKGFSDKENRALNLAGVCAVFVAMLPPTVPGGTATVVNRVHATFAVSFFLCIAYVSLFRSSDTLHLLQPEAQRTYQRRYRLAGLALLASPVGALGLSLLDSASPFRTLIFWLEALAVWAFAAYWIIKTGEMRLSHAEKRSLDGELERQIVSTGTASTERVVPKGLSKVP